MTNYDDAKNTSIDDLPEYIEGFIDTHGLAALLDTIEEVCNLKAEHLRTNWQDEDSATEWEKHAEYINVANHRISSY